MKLFLEPNHEYSKELLRQLIMKNNKITLLSFGTKNLIKSTNRLRQQAKNFKIYDEISKL